LTEAELQAAHALTPHLLRNGIRIAGIDLIGDQIVEVNTLNPGGLHYADAFQDPAAPCIAQEAMQLLVTPPLPHALPTSRTHKANQA
jgi:glutathione synthase